jgi:hypothetical protein
VQLSFGLGCPVVEFVEQIVDLEEEMNPKYLASGSYGRINVGGN